MDQGSLSFLFFSGQTDNPCQVHPPDILNQLAEAKWKLLQEERLVYATY